MKFSRIFLLSALAAIGFTACDNVDEADRFDGPISVEGKKNVLIEDFTGQRCSNCPLAADKVAELQGIYGHDRVIAVSIHGGGLSVSEESNPKVGLANAQGNAYNTYWGVESWPSGLIDRSGGLLDYTSWQAEVIKRFTQDVKADVNISALSYDTDTRTVSFEVETENLDAAAVSGKLQVWLTENDIVRTQMLPPSLGGGTDRNYVHKHVFRASVNDPFGDAVTVNAGETLKRTYTYTIKDNWVPENMAVVAFVYNDADGVLQVTERALAAE